MLVAFQGVKHSHSTYYTSSGTFHCDPNTVKEVREFQNRQVDEAGHHTILWLRFSESREEAILCTYEEFAQHLKEKKEDTNTSSCSSGVL